MSTNSVVEVNTVDTSVLTESEKRHLEIQGYLLLKDVIAPDDLSTLRELFEEGVKIETKVSGQGTRHISDLFEFDERFKNVCLHPKLLAVAALALKTNFVPMRVHGRDPRPGFGKQGLHMDWITPMVNGRALIVTAIAMLDSFTNDNGATRIVPATHMLQRVEKLVSDPQFVHPKQVLITAPAGSVLVFSGHLLHSATENRSQTTRRTLQISFQGLESIRTID